MKGINPLKVFNIWMVNDKKTKYEIVDTIDIEVKIDEDYYSNLSRKIKFPLASFMIVKAIGEKVQKRILSDRMFRKYDAWVLSHIGMIYKGKIMVSIDVFKLKVRKIKGAVK